MVLIGKTEPSKMVFIALKNYYLRTSLGVQWLRLHTPNVGSEGSIPGLGNKTSHAAQCGQNRKHNKNCWLSPLTQTSGNFRKYSRQVCEDRWRRMVVEHYFFWICFLNLSDYILFIYFFWLPWAFDAAAGFLLLPRAGSTLWVRCVGFSLQWHLLLQSTCSRAYRLW